MAHCQYWGLKFGFGLGVGRVWSLKKISISVPFLSTFPFVLFLPIIISIYVQHTHTQCITYTLSTVHTHSVQYIHTQYSTYTFSTVHTHSVQYIHIQYSTYTLSTVHTHSVQYIHTQYSTYT